MSEFMQERDWRNQVASLLQENARLREQLVAYKAAADTATILRVQRDEALDKLAAADRSLAEFDTENTRLRKAESNLASRLASAEREREEARGKYENLLSYLETRAVGATSSPGIQDAVLRLPTGASHGLSDSQESHSVSGIPGQSVDSSIAPTCPTCGAYDRDEAVTEVIRIGREYESAIMAENTRLRAAFDAFINAPPTQMSYAGGLVPVNDDGMRQMVDENTKLKAALAEANTNAAAWEHLLYVEREQRDELRATLAVRTEALRALLEEVDYQRSIGNFSATLSVKDAARKALSSSVPDEWLEQIRAAVRQARELTEDVPPGEAQWEYRRKQILDMVWRLAAPAVQALLK